MHVNAPFPRIRKREPSVPVSLEKVINRMAQKDPAKRPPSAGATIKALHLAMMKKKKPALRNRRNWTPVLVAVIVAALLCSIALLIWAN